ncbi:diadenylate cyclase CdaA [Peptoniphilus sp. KCTC 25270]|uniref:diadenylate cyclase CdaA n=1 Tax=Peptoniphilus sp. KCTC 25270 TaxID=2897414 RepID=UPI001E2A037D|nr:diadenylate cyclase CdaA [Peptoniphilus sp. KCTC 25270]MCD1147130.1 diadenylate cyclase CdaA [Peptoniphilus sp. KCTC 25270]
MIDFINRSLSTLRIQDIIDIAIVAVVVYWLYKLLRGTRAEQLSKGIIILLVLTKASEWFELFTVHYLLSNLMTLGFLALLIVFQPELRRGLEFIGRSSSLRTSLLGDQKKRHSAIRELIDAIGSLSRQKIGALIVIERQTGLSEIVDTGTKLNARISSALLINIFIPNTPLHDGAVVIKDETILSAASFLPLSDERNISKELGTRHRAALGISERSDCMAIVVSEETGSISVAEYGKLSRHIDLPSLETMLESIYLPENLVDTDRAGRWGRGGRL